MCLYLIVHTQGPFLEGSMFILLRWGHNYSGYSLFSSQEGPGLTCSRLTALDTIRDHGECLLAS